jgi:hypothetical protein
MFRSKLLRRLALPATLAAASLVVAACASGPEARADYDYSADFGKYRTHGVVSQTTTSSISPPEFKSLALQAIQSAAAPWGGVEGIVSTEMLRNPQASLTDAVARVFEGYPFVAGQSVPVAPEGSGLR